MPGKSAKTTVIVVGAGPAGLTAAYLLAKRGIDVVVLEADANYVGGISRTVVYRGFRFDIGGHRFFSKSRQVEDLWTEILPDDMLTRPRRSRIFYRGQFFSYPLRGFDALWKLGVFESIRCLLSYGKARLFPISPAKNFEQWVTNHFGSRLFRIFFKTYTEKVWGMDCQEISADWAAQRIMGFSLQEAIVHALMPRGTKHKPKTLIDSFRYPRLGPGMLWEACEKKVRALGGRVFKGCRAEGFSKSETTGQWTVRYRGPSGELSAIEAEHVISSAPLSEVVQRLTPAASQPVLRAAKQLRYRDFITVMLMFKGAESFSDNWIYIHDPHVKVGRIQNFKSWSPEMVPDPTHSCYGMEYFCFDGDSLWTMSDEDLIALAKRELVQIGLATSEAVIDGYVLRQPKAYPVYDDEYAAHVATIRKEIESKYASLHLVGRNGMHKYNNQDHAMMTAMLTVENILAGKVRYDVWKVNQDAECHEDSGEEGLRKVPTSLRKRNEAA